MKNFDEMLEEELQDKEFKEAFEEEAERIKEINDLNFDLYQN